MERILFLYNPHAGKGKIKFALSDIIELFVNANYEITIHSTICKGDAMKVASEQGELYDIIVASGGDGTLSEVINGVMQLEKKPHIGFIPAGTTNDFAMNFKIPKTNINAAKTIVIGKPFPYDIGSFNGNYFHYVASFGIFSNVAYSTPQAFKNAVGRLAYLFEGAKSLVTVRSYEMKVEFDGNLIEDEFIFGMITNANSVGGFKSITGKNVALNDGLFEVMLVKMPQNPVELQNILNNLVFANNTNNYIYKFKAANIKISCEKMVDWTLDGEFGGRHTHVTIINHKQAIKFLVEESIVKEVEDIGQFETEDVSKLVEKVDDDMFDIIANNILYGDLKEDKHDNKKSSDNELDRKYSDKDDSE